MEIVNVFEMDLGWKKDIKVFLYPIICNLCVVFSVDVLILEKHHVSLFSMQHIRSVTSHGVVYTLVNLVVVPLLGVHGAKVGNVDLAHKKGATNIILFAHVKIAITQIQITQKLLMKLIFVLSSQKFVVNMENVMMSKDSLFVNVHQDLAQQIKEEIRKMYIKIIYKSNRFIWSLVVTHYLVVAVMIDAFSKLIIWSTPY